MLGSSSGKFGGARLSRPADILDTVGISILLHDRLSLEGEDIDVMLVVKINASNLHVVLSESNGCNTSGSLANLDTGIFGGVSSSPNEHGWRRSNLSSDTLLLVRANVN